MSALLERFKKTFNGEPEKRQRVPETVLTYKADFYKRYPEFMPKLKPQDRDAAQMWLDYFNCHKILEQNYAKTGEVKATCICNTKTIFKVAQKFEDDGFKTEFDDYEYGAMNIWA